MIFITVGNHVPFNRLIRAVDEWAASRLRHDVLAQIGTDAWIPRWISHVEELTPTEFQQHIRHASLVVAHAGIGTIVNALQHGKRIIVMPRSSDLHETRNNHQFATVQHLCTFPNLSVAHSEQDLPALLDAAHSSPAPDAHRFPPFPATADPALIQTLRSFIHSNLLPD